MGRRKRKIRKRKGRLTKLRILQLINLHWIRQLNNRLWTPLLMRRLPQRVRNPQRKRRRTKRKKTNRQKRLLKARTLQPTNLCWRLQLMTLLLKILGSRKRKRRKKDKVKEVENGETEKLLEEDVPVINGSEKKKKKKKK